MTNKSESMIEDAFQWLYGNRRSGSSGCTNEMRENLTEMYLAYAKLKTENQTLHFILTEAAAIGMQRKDNEPKIVQDWE